MVHKVFQASLTFIVIAFCSTANAIPLNLGLNVAVFSGMFGGGVDVGLTQSISAGATGAYGRKTLNNNVLLTTQALALRADYTNRVFTDGVYYALVFFTGRAVISTTGQEDMYGKAEGQVQRTNFSVRCGYGWYWDIGFNIRADLGLALGGTSGEVKYTAPDGTSGTQSLEVTELLVGEVLFGWVLGREKNVEGIGKKKKKGKKRKK